VNATPEQAIGEYFEEGVIMGTGEEDSRETQEVHHFVDQTISPTPPTIQQKQLKRQRNEL